MNKRIGSIALVIILAIGGSVIYLLKQPSEEVTNDLPLVETTEIEGQTVDVREGDTVDIATGAYVDYSSDVISKTTGTKIIFFHAPWCPQCRDLDADIKKRGVPEGVTIIKTDYDTNQPLRQKYGVTLQTTFVRVNNSGELVEKFVAYDDPTLDAVVKNLL